MPLTTLQKRGALTVPQGDRTALHWCDGQLILTTVQPPDTLCLRAIPDAETLFARHAAGSGSDISNTVPPTSGVWIPAAALWHAHAQPTSPWRPIWQALSHGMSTRRCDPTILATWADQMARVFPTLTRAEHAAYLQAVCAWPGVDLPDRTFWLSVCEQWGHSEQTWSDVVWQIRNNDTADTPDEVPAVEDATPVVSKPTP